jgi:hypothetical protein
VSPVKGYQPTDSDRLFPNYGLGEYKKVNGVYKFEYSSGGDLTFQGVAEAGSDVFGGSAWGYNPGDVVGSNAAAKGGVQYTKSSLQLGQQMHKSYKLGAEGIKEFRLPSGRRIDFLDIKTVLFTS